jgi:lysophospholipase L1-like esterase
MKQPPRTTWRVPLIASVLVTVFLCTVCEGLARLAFYARQFVGVSDLNEYEFADPHTRKLWRLRPGYASTLEQAIAAKEKSGRVLGVEYLKQRGARLGVKPQDVIFRINQHGFKGPELDRRHSRIRILTLGDSCTFGSPFDAYSYPRTLEHELAQSGREIEVVNGGVEGYGPTQVLARIEEFKALKPEITTIYIGWNALYSYDSLPKHDFLYTPWLVRTAYERLFPQRAALSIYNKAKHPDKNDPEIKQLDWYVPSFLDTVEQVVRQMQTSGSKVVIITLPGLYTTNEEPSAHALEIGHLPQFMTNPYVLAKMAEEYNAALRRLAQRGGLQLVDLAKWSDTALQPRDAYFFDSVHLYEEGQQMIGKYLAQQLVPLLAEHSSSSPGTTNAPSPPDTRSTTRGMTNEISARSPD